MNLKTSRAKYLKFAILIISICILLGAISACLPYNISIPEMDESLITPTASNIVSNAGSLSRFVDGTSYVFTDKNKIAGYRAGTEAYDITIVEVNSSATIGTQTNPYVISTTDEWEIFVKQMAIDTTYGSGQYFVLANDLDFDGVDFHPVVNFRGTFYGLGYSLKNITVNNWQYWNTGTNSYVSIGSSNIALSGFGVFCRTMDATITDLIIQDYNFINTPQNSSGIANHGPFVGAVVGYSYGNNNILNCHTSGNISSSVTYTTHIVIGGIVGMHGIANTTVLEYRCSAEIDMSTNTTSSMSVVAGGMVGYPMTNAVAIVYDCVANVKASGSFGYDNITACFGWTISSSVIENFVGTDDITSSTRSYSGVVVGAGHTGISIKNVYVEGHRGAPGNKNSEYPVAGNVGNLAVANVSNINVVRDTSAYPLYDSTVRDALPSGTTIEHGSSATMISTAKTFFSATPYSNIWDVDKIGGDYTPDNSPVRNYLMAFINFRNLTNGGNSEEKVGLDDGVGYTVGDKLPDETSDVSAFTTYLNNKKNANHVFKGWTDDPTGESKPFTELPSGYFGNLTLYAVWGLPDSYVNSNIKTSLSVDKNLIEYDSVASITLTAKVEHIAPSSGAMTNPKPKYYFIQDGDEKTTTADVKSSGVLSVKTVKDSGKYTFKYRLTDGLEPLWRYDGTPTNSVDIEIEKGKLAHMTLKDFKISASTVPYFGKKLEDITFTVSMFNNANKEVELAEVRWQSTIGKVDNKGTNTKKIVLCPVDTDNYEEQYVFDATFESQSLVIVFNLAQISQKIEVEVEYGQNYGANEIIYLFEQAYLKALSTWDAEIVGDVSSMAPYLDGKALVEGDANADKFDTEYNGINEIHTIQVTFKDASYEVVFNPNNGGGSSPTQETYGYGQFLKKPTDPVNGDLLFVGWYFDEDYIDDNGNEATRNRAWRFNSVGDIPQDRVTKAVTLIAKWLKADTLDSIKVEVDPSKKYMAQTSLQEGDLIVTATYSGEVDGQKIEQEVVLSWSDFASG
ncbi:MAG: InlB B-repeat-containing protein, partial [Clostridia bacterium]|nr:InlB B-repeat-containing protein [Clostridia bacterium]